MELTGHVAKRAFNYCWPNATLLDDDKVYVSVDYTPEGWEMNHGCELCGPDNWQDENLRVVVGTATKRFYPKYKFHRAVHQSWLNCTLSGREALNFLSAVMR